MGTKRLLVIILFNGTIWKIKIIYAGMEEMNITIDNLTRGETYTFSVDTISYTLTTGLKENLLPSASVTISK